MTEGLAAAAVVLTQVASPDVLAAACALHKVPIEAVPTPVGSVAVCRSTGEGDPEAAAAVISRLLTNTPVVLVVQRDGQMSASRWVGGQQGERLSAALMLDGAPPEIERLLLGQVAPEGLPGVVSSQMSRWRAMRRLARVARAARRARTGARRAGARERGGRRRGAAAETRRP